MLDSTEIGIIGAGRLALSLGRCLYAKGIEVSVLGVREPQRDCKKSAFVSPATRVVSIEQVPDICPRILLAVSDQAIEKIVTILSRSRLKATPRLILHTSGALGWGCLEPLCSAGFSCGTLHPLQSISTPEQGVRSLPGCTFAVSGQEPALEWATEIVEILGGQSIGISDSQRSLYHASAVVASNYLVSVLHLAIRLMEDAGVEHRTARQALGPLCQTTLENVLCQGAAKALTGPIERGDIETVERNWAGVEGSELSRAQRQFFRDCAAYTIEVARAKGTELEQLEAMERLVTNWTP